MEPNRVTVKISRQRLEALHRLYEHTIANDVPEDINDHMLHAHIVALYWRFDQMLNGRGHNQTKNFTMQISACEALAFWIYWGEAVIPDAFADIVVREVIKCIDKEHGNIRLLLSAKDLSVWN